MTGKHPHSQAAASRRRFCWLWPYLAAWLCWGAALAAAVEAGGAAAGAAATVLDSSAGAAGTRAFGGHYGAACHPWRFRFRGCSGLGDLQPALRRAAAGGWICSGRLDSCGRAGCWARASAAGAHAAAALARRSLWLRSAQLSAHHGRVWRVLMLAGTYQAPRARFYRLYTRWRTLITPRQSHRGILLR